MIEKRLAALRALLVNEQLDAVIVTKYVNLHYFSGFRGDDTTLVISAERAVLVTDSRYTEQAKMQAPLYELVEQKDGLLQKTADVVKEIGCQKVGFEGNALIYDDFAKLTELMPEIEFVTRAAKGSVVADAAFEDILGFIRPGVTELAVAARMEGKMRELGAEEPAFKTIVASGLRGALPHGIATDKTIGQGELVTMDFGAMYEGYCSDMTRTICVGKADERQKEIYGAVLSAQKHGLGHSLGLEIHEAPRLSRLSTCEALVPGMLITDEPGVYIPGWGGIRIEDTVLVTETGSEALISSDKELIEL